MESRNPLDELFTERSINVSDFARKHDIKPSTLYNVLRNNSQLGRTGIDTFLKIAHGLNMTADELYEYCFVRLDDDAE